MSFAWDGITLVELMVAAIAEAMMTERDMRASRHSALRPADGLGDADRRAGGGARKVNATSRLEEKV